MSVRSTLDKELKGLNATDLEKEIARALARTIDDNGSAAAVKELRSLMTALADRKPEVNALDELTARCNARRTS